MADLLNIPSCGVNSTGNTGAESCDVIRKVPKGVILTDGGVSFSAADRASIPTFIAALRAKTVAARGGRVYPINDLVNWEDKSSEASRGSLGNLTQAQVDLVDAIPEFGLRHFNGEAFHKKLSRFNSQQPRVFIYDDANQIFGTVDSNGNLKGYSLTQFRTLFAKFADSGNSAQYGFKLVLKSAGEYRDNSGYVVLDSTLTALSGLIDVVLSVTNQSANVIKVKAATEGAGTNLGDLYSAVLNSSSLWVCKNFQTGATITITSVTWDAATSSFVVTVDSTTYTALTSGQKFTIDLAAASALDAANVTPYESKGPVTLTKP